MMFLKSLKGLRSRKFKDWQKSIYPLIKKQKPKTNMEIRVKPKTFDDVIDHVIATMSFGEKVIFANLDEDALFQLQLSFGIIIQEQLEKLSTKRNLNEFQAADVIIKKIWKRLRKKYRAFS